MKQEEAIRRIGVLIKAHVELLYELVAIEERVPAGDFDSDAGRRELNQEVTVHTRKLFRVLKTKRDFEIELFGLAGEENDEQGLERRQHQEVAQDPQASARP